MEIIGKGKIASVAPTKPNDENVDDIKRFGRVYIKLDDGSSVRYKTKNFSPTSNFYATCINNVLAFEYEFPKGNIGGHKFKDKYFELMSTISCRNIIEKLKGLKKEELDIIYNYPYALAGFDFTRKDLKDYFTQFIWYSPVSKNVKIDKSYNDFMKAVKKVKEQIKE